MRYLLLIVLKYVPNVTVHKQPKILRYEDATCLLMPWRRNSEHEKETSRIRVNRKDRLYVLSYRNTRCTNKP